VSEAQRQEIHGGGRTRTQGLRGNGGGGPASARPTSWLRAGERGVGSVAPASAPVVRGANASACAALCMCRMGWG